MNAPKSELIHQLWTSRLTFMYVNQYCLPAVAIYNSAGLSANTICLCGTRYCDYLIGIFNIVLMYLWK